MVWGWTASPEPVAQETGAAPLGLDQHFLLNGTLF